MNYQATLTYTEPLLRRAVFAFWRRSVGVGTIVITASTASTLMLSLRHGYSSWWVGVLGTLSLLSVVMACAVYIVHYRNAMKKFRDMGKPEASFLAEEASFSITSGIGSATLQWSSIMQVWRFPEFWLLLFSKAQFITVPLGSVEPDMQAFVLKQVQAAGGKVIG